MLPFQKYIQANIASFEWQVILWAAAEEIVKFIAVVLLLYRTGFIDEATDWPIYLMTAALGFAALENVMFLIKPFSLGESTVAILTGHLRFLGATLLHTISSGVLGIALGFCLNSGRVSKGIHFVVGMALAICLHSVFNFFIMKEAGNDIIKAMGFLWVAAIVVMLIFEKLRRMSDQT